jgi:carbon storage regulator
MLVLTRNIGETIIINGDIEVTVTEIQGGQVKVGIEAPKDVIINREEIHNKVQAEQLKTA